MTGTFSVGRNSLWLTSSACFTKYSIPIKSLYLRMCFYVLIRHTCTIHACMNSACCIFRVLHGILLEIRPINLKKSFVFFNIFTLFSLLFNVVTVIFIHYQPILSMGKFVCKNKQKDRIKCINSFNYILS